MKLIIEIDKEKYNQIVNSYQGSNVRPKDYEIAIINGTPITDDATNGEVIKAMFPNAKIEHQGGIVRFIVDGWSFQIAEDWWNAPYQKGGKE